jgi:hypothetical protein
MEEKNGEDPFAAKSKAKAITRLKEQKNQLKNTMQDTDQSTASLGNLTDKNKTRKPKKVPRAHRNAAEERVKSLEILSDVMRKKQKLVAEKV